MSRYTQAMPVRLHALDLGVVGLYLAAITLFGLRFSRHRAAGRAGSGAAEKDRSLRGYFLANKTIPWWAIALSIVSAETSTLTIIGTPGLAFAGDFGFLQIVIGYMIGRMVVGLALPAQILPAARCSPPTNSSTAASATRCTRSPPGSF